jgi:hypothetical protein
MILGDKISFLDLKCHVIVGDIDQKRNGSLTSQRAILIKDQIPYNF